MTKGSHTIKKIFVISFIMINLVSACGPSGPVAITPSEGAPIVPTVPASPTPSATEIPPTSTPVPAVSLPVSQLTPVPSSSTKIIAENVKDLQEVARYYGEIKYFARVTKDNAFLFILDPDGLIKYDYTSMDQLAYIPLANSLSDFQISDDGRWLLIDNNWLLDLENNKEPKLFLLSEKIHLLNFYTRSFALSPDGSIIAVQQGQLRCDVCEHILRIISTKDFGVLHTSSGLTNQSLPTFSPDGKYLALADLLIEAHSDGSSNPVGGSASILNSSDYTKVSSFGIKFPFYVTGIAFSEESNLIAIAQRTSIDIYDVLSGEPKVTIDNLCDSYQRKVMFAPNSPLRLVEDSDCSNGVWLISENRPVLSVLYGYAADLSRIAFDENGKSKQIPYPYPTVSNLGAYGSEFYFRFLNAAVISFKGSDAETSDKYSCDLSLGNGSFACQSHAAEFNGRRSLGEDVILATDGKYYAYVVGNQRVDIYPLENPSQVYYSIPFRDFHFTLYALDPINDIIIYEFAIGGNSSRVIIQDMKNDRILEKWEGETFISSIGFSENSRIAALCRTIGNYSNPLEPYKDRLTIFDLLEKRTVYNTEFNCSAALDMSNDGSKLAIEHHYVQSPDDGLFSSRAMILNTTPPYEKEFIEFDSFLFPYAVAFSPDGSVLAVGCGGIEICFFDSSGDHEIYRLKAHSGVTNLAFSPDGSFLATSSNWGLISLWAVPPFDSNTSQQTQSSPLSYDPSYYWDFNQDDYLEGWGEEDWQSEGLNNLIVKDGYFSAIATDSGSRLNNSDESLGINANEFSQIEIRMRVSGGSYAVIYFTHADKNWIENKGKYFDLIPDNQFHTYLIAMSEVATWKGTIEQLRLDPVHDAPGATIDIDYIHVLP